MAVCPRYEYIGGSVFLKWHTFFLWQGYKEI
jgi:hypothetical protein